MGSYLEGLVAARRQRLARMQDAVPAVRSVDAAVKRDDIAAIMARLGTVEERLASLTRQRPQAEGENADRSNPLVAAVRGVICREYAITLADLLGPSLCPSVVQARQVAMYLCRKIAPMSYTEIACHFGKRNHTTALHACAKVDRTRMTDEKLDRRLMALESEIRSSSVSGK